jgi:NUMOD3 motif
VSLREDRESAIVSLVSRNPEGVTRSEIHLALSIPYMSLDRLLRKLLRDERLEKVPIKRPGKKRPFVYMYILPEWDGTRRKVYKRVQENPPERGPHSEETKRKIAEAHRGKKRGPLPAAVRAKISAAHARRRSNAIQA